MVRSPRPLFVKDALLLSFVPPRVEEGHLRVESGRVVAAGRGTAVQRGDEVLDRWGKPVAPAFVLGCHRLLAAPGWGEPRPEEKLEPAAVHPLACLSLLDALACGATTVVHFHPTGAPVEGALGALALALRETGLRGIAALEIGRDEAAAERTRGEIRRFLAEGSDSKVRLAFAVDAATAEAPSVLERLSSFRSEFGLPLHVAIGGEEGAARRGLASLAAAGFLGPGTLFTGSARAGGEVLRRALARGAWLGASPRAEAARGGGRSPLEEFGDRVALGTDGFGGDLLEEIRFAEALARKERVRLDPARLLAGGYGFARERFDLPFGALEPGAPADLVLLDYLPAFPLSAETLGAHLLEISSRHVEGVLIDGRGVYRRREPMFPVDRDPLVERARALRAPERAQA